MEKVAAFDSWVPLWESTGWPLSQWEFQDAQMKLLYHIPSGILWLFNIAMENGPFIDDFPIDTSIYKGFPWLC